MRSPRASMHFRRSSVVRGGAAQADGGRGPACSAPRGAGAFAAVVIKVVLPGKAKESAEHAGSPKRLALPLHFPLPDGAQPAQFGAPPGIAWLHVVLALAQLLDKPAPFEQLLEAAQGGTHRFAVVDSHPERHSRSSWVG